MRRLSGVLYALFLLAIMAGLFYFVVYKSSGQDFAEAEIITTDMIITWCVMGMSAGGLLMMAVYNFSLYLFRRSEKAALYFAVICVFSAARILLHYGGIIHMLTAMPYPLVMRLQNISLCASAMGIAAFVFELFDDRQRRRLYRSLMAGMALVILVLMFVNSDDVRTVFAVIIPPLAFGSCFYVVLRSGRLRESSLNKLYLFALAVFILGMFVRIAAGEVLPFIAVFTNFFFLLVHTIILSDRYARDMAAVEETNARLEEKVAERTAELLETNRALAESERGIRELVHGVSHDLKTPLAVLGVNLEMLRDRDVPADSSDFTRYVEVAWQKSRDLTRLAGGLLDAARAGSDGQPLRTEWVRLSALLAEAHGKYAPDVEGGGVNFSASFDADGEVCLDKDAIWRILDNLVGNAKRYTRPGGLIALQAGAPENGQIPLTVADSGDGVEPEHLPRLFDAYYKADLSRGGGDSGLGLYIVKTLAEGMGGSVSARSAPGQGLAVTLRFGYRQQL